MCTRHEDVLVEEEKKWCEARTEGKSGYCGTCEATGTLDDEETRCPCCEGHGIH